MTENEEQQRPSSSDEDEDVPSMSTTPLPSGASMQQQDQNEDDGLSHHSNNRHRNPKSSSLFHKLFPVTEFTKRRQVFKLRDGRRLKYDIDGPTLDESTKNLPVIFTFHGMFLSGQSFMQQQRPPTDYNIVSINRPGYHGSSCVKVGLYSYKEFAFDIEELADFLHVNKFSVVGHSSGGPNALACAYYMPDRIKSIGILAGDPEYYAVAEERKKKNNSKYNVDSTADKDGKEIDDNDDGGGDYYDSGEICHHKSLLMDCCMGCFVPNCMRLVPCLQVTNGLRNDYYLERQCYGFNTEDIIQPTIVVLGNHDTILPNDVAMKVHQRLPNSQLQILDGLGHNCLLKDDILDMVFRKVIELAKMTTTVTTACEKVEIMPSSAATVG